LNRGFVAKSVVSLLRELGISRQSVKKIVKEVSDEAVKSSRWIWISRSSSSWGPAGGALRVNRLLEEIQDVFKWRVWPM